MEIIPVLVALLPTPWNYVAIVMVILALLAVHVYKTLK